VIEQETALGNAEENLRRGSGEEVMDFPGDLKYSKTHEWVRIEGDEAVIGVTG